MNINRFSLLFLIAVAGTLSLSADDDNKVQTELSAIKAHLVQPTIKVQLLQSPEGALVEVKGAYNVYDPRTAKKLDSAYLASSYYMYPTTDGLKWGQEFPGVYQLLLVPDKKETTVLIGGTEYRGLALLYQIQGNLAPVNEVSLEDFVASALSTHVPAHISSKEALSALAIAMRTEAFAAKQMAKNPYWDVKAISFGYRGYAVERHDPAFVEAMRNTRGMILKNPNSGQLAQIRWFAAGESMAPMQEIEGLAQEGKDAKAILSKLFPEDVIARVK